MSHKIHYLIVFLLMLTGIAACKKSENGGPPPLRTVFISPEENAHYQNGDTVYINVTVQSEIDLHGYHWELKIKENGTSIKTSAHQHVHGKTLSIQDYWVCDVADETALTLEINILTDHEKDPEIVTRDIFCKP